MTTMLSQNGFEMHGLQHTSVSAINSWEECPDQWVAKYLHGIKFPGSPAMWRGICTEDAVRAVIEGGDSIEDAIKAALKVYDDKNGFDEDPAVEKERQNIAPMTEMAIEELKQYGKPEFPDGMKQHKVEMLCKTDDFQIPMIGYLDFVYPQHGLVVDLKTTLRAPSSMSKNHIRQRCFYEKAMGNHAVKFLYITPKKAIWLEDGDVNDEMAEIKATLIRQERFLRAGDKDFLTSIVPVNPNHFYWRDAVAVRKKLYGL
jgi:hypothetical protein